MEKMMIDLIVLDIDGVLTDGKKYYDATGIPFAKTYCDKDFTAIKRFRGSGVQVCFLSGDKNINEQMASNRKIPFYYSRGKDKADFLEELSSRFSTSPEKMVYVGDDLFDLSIMKKVGYAFCPSDACRDLLHFCTSKGNTLMSKGGENVIEELFNDLLDRDLIKDCTIEDIENLDKLEVF